MRHFVQAGITTFDCADIYTGVEELIGKFRKKSPNEFLAGDFPPIQNHTKYVPDYSALATLTKEQTTTIIDPSLKRLGVE
ncbi:MAG: aryl-alcohol dehydrogenase-like predicted oxidoreductase, partial [Maribacter sp.]